MGGAIGSWRGQWEGLLGVEEVSGRGYWELERSVGGAIGHWGVGVATRVEKSVGVATGRW